MHERAERLAGRLVSLDCDLEREFEARVTDCATLAFRVAFSVLRNREDAEDVAQEAFAKAYRNFLQLRDRAHFRPWLVRVTWRLAIDRQRNNRRRAARELRAEPAPMSSAAETLEERQRAERLWSAIDRLPEKLRLAIVLAGIEGYNVAEVASLLGIPEGTVKSRLFLARKQLKDRLSWTITNTDR